MTSPQGMRIKSYFARSVDDALNQARKELGDEAMLLNTRKFAASVDQPAGYEVVFGVAGDPTPAAPAAAAPVLPVVQTAPVRVAAKPKSAPAAPVVDAKAPPEVHADVHPARYAPTMQRHEDLAEELDRLHAQMDEIRGMLVRSSKPQISIGRTVPELADVYSNLMAAEVEPVLCKDIIDRLEASMATDAFFQGGQRRGGPEKATNRWKAMRFDPARLEAFVRAELGGRVGIEAKLGLEDANGIAVVLVGPTGAGKTTSLMKLAASNLVGGKQVRLLSLDATRSAGQIQLQAFASNLGHAFSSVPSIHALRAIVNEARKKREAVFIDTPGYAGSDGRAAELAAETLAKIPGLDVHLVAPAYMKAGDLRRCVQKYEVFRPGKLLATKLDETQTLGSIFSEAARARLALSFLAHGPSIPEDIRPATADDLAALALGSLTARGQAQAQVA